MKNFDEIIRDKIYNAEMPVASGVWESIEKNLDRKDKRPFIWLMLVMMLTGMPAIYYGIYYQTAESDKLSKNTLAWMSDNDSDYTKVIGGNYTLIPTMPALSFVTNDALKSQSIVKRQSLGFQIASGKKQRNVNLNLPNASIDEFTTDSYASVNSAAEISDIKVDRLSTALHSLTEMENALFGTKMECPRFRQKWPIFYAYGSVRLDYPMQNLMAGATELNSLLEQRRATESAMPSFGLEGGLGYDFYSGLFIQAGIAYNQVNIKFSHEAQDVINNRTSIVIDTLFNPEGEILSITRDTSIIQEIGINKTVANNTFRMLDIPIEIGYHYPVSKSFNLRASVGVAFNVRTQSSGYMVDSNGDPFHYGSSDSNYFKTKTGLSYLASLVMETKVSEKIYLNAGLRMRYYGTEFNSSENPVDQTFTNLGLSAGLRYRI